MEFKFDILDRTTAYTGRELRTGWVAQATGLEGDAAVGFIGPCHVRTDDLVDLEDAARGERIEAERMAHVIVEHPGCPLEVGVLRQRILVCLLCEILFSRGVAVRREGDDIYWKRKKLTVSIAAPSEKSTLIHLGINIRPAGAPVPAVGLEEMGVEPGELLEELLKGYRNELSEVARAEGKVRRVP